MSTGAAWEWLEDGFLDGSGMRKGREESDIILFQLKTLKKL